MDASGRWEGAPMGPRPKDAGQQTQAEGTPQAQDGRVKAEVFVF